MTSKLTVQQVYGLSAYTRNTISNLDDRNIIYVSGNQVIILNVESKDQTFLNLIPNNNIEIYGVSAISISTQKKFIAVAEKGESLTIPPSIAFYDTVNHKKKRVLNFPDATSNEICSMAFCSDGHLFITQSKHPDWTLTLWGIDKTNRILSTAKTTVAEDSVINQIAFCPYDSNIILVTGKGILKLYRVVESQLRPVTLNVKREIVNFTAHCWLNAEVMILGADTGELFLIENLEYRGIIFPADPFSPNPFSANSRTMTGGSLSAGISTRSITSHGHSAGGANEPEKVLPVHSLIPTSKGGFIAGLAEGEIVIFEKHTAVHAHHSSVSNAQLYQIETRVQIPSKKGAIHSLMILNEDNLILSTDTQQLLNFNLSSLDQAKENQLFDPLFTLFHEPSETGEASIVSLGTSLWKPNIVFTCGKDNTLKLWNIEEQKLELSKVLEEEPLFMSVHPSGIYIAIAFEGKIKIFSILKDDIHTINQLPVRSCTALSYSKGGQFISAASGSTIHIFDSLTGQPVCALRGHNNRIKNIVWQDYDAGLLSFGYEGSVYFWDIFPAQKRPEFHNCNISTTAGTGFRDGSVVFCSNVDKHLNKIMFNVNGVNTTNLPVGSAVTTGTGVPMQAVVSSSTEMIDLKREVTIMLVDEYHSMLLVGTSGAPHKSNGHESLSLTFEENNPEIAETENGGTIKATSGGALFRIPLNFESVPNFIPEVSCLHSTAITAICLSADGNSLFTADESGCLIVSSFEATTTTGVASAVAMKPGAGVAGVKANANNQDANANFQFSEEIMILNTDIEKIDDEIRKLNMEIADVINSNNRQYKNKELDNEKALNKLFDRMAATMKDETVQYQSILDDKSKMMKSFADEYSAFEMSSADEVESLEKKFIHKLTVENNRLESLKKEMDIADKKWKEASTALSKSHEAYIKDITEENESLLQDEVDLHKELSEQKIKLTNTSKERGLLIKSDVDNEISQIKTSYESRIKTEEANVADLATKNTNIKKDLQAILAELQQHKEEVVRMKEKEARLIENNKSFEKEIQNQKKEIREREDAISEKDKRMIELKKKNQELEKFRFVLDYKIKELKLQIAPSEKEITSMKKQMEEMSMELLQYQKSSQSLNVMMNELKLKIDGVKHELENEEYKINENDIIIHGVHRDLHRLQQVLESNDNNQLKQEVIQLFRDYCQTEQNNSGDTNFKPSKQMSSSTSTPKFLKDPERTYNRDREQMERNIVSLSRLVKTGTGACHRDIRHKQRDHEELLQELELLRKDMEKIKNQKDMIDTMIQANGGERMRPEDLDELLAMLGYDNKKTPLQTLKTNSMFGTTSTSSGLFPHLNSTNDGFNLSQQQPPKPPQQLDPSAISNAWDQVERQSDLMKDLEMEIERLCDSLQLDSVALLEELDSKLVIS